MVTEILGKARKISEIENRKSQIADRLPPRRSSIFTSFQFRVSNIAGWALVLLGSMSLLGAEEPVLQPPSGSATEARPTKTASQPGAADYVVSPDDLLEVNVFDVSEFSRTYR